VLQDEGDVLQDQGDVLQDQGDVLQDQGDGHWVHVHRNDARPGDTRARGTAAARAR